MQYEVVQEVDITAVDWCACCCYWQQRVLHSKYQIYSNCPVSWVTILCQRAGSLKLVDTVYHILAIGDLHFWKPFLEYAANFQLFLEYVWDWLTWDSSGLDGSEA